MAEVDQESKLQATGFQVIHDLCFVLVGNFLHCLQFHNDLFVAKQIRDVFVLQRLTSLAQCQFLLAFIRNATMPEFDLHAFLVNRLHESMPLVIVDCEASPHDLVNFVFE
jgi:hypothetical protein